MKVTALIPAYNEESTIGKIIQTLQNNKNISDILVVDDGSSDATASVARNAGVQVISLQKNQGKGAALQSGIEVVKNEVILMLDSDLIGLKDEHIYALLLPVFNDQCDMTVGVFNDGRGLTDLAQFFAPNLSGQRAVKTDIIKNIRNLKNSGYGVEVAINRFIKKNGRLKYVELNDLTHVMKEEKRGFAKGAIDRLKMYWDIIRITLTKSNAR